MALIKCPECGKEISDKAKSCPNCGYEVNKKSLIMIKNRKKLSKRNIIVSCILVVILMVFLIFQMQSFVGENKFKETYLFSNYSNTQPSYVDDDFEDKTTIRELYPLSTSFNEYEEALKDIGFTKYDITLSYGSKIYKFEKKNNDDDLYDYVFIMVPSISNDDYIGIQVQYDNEKKQ